MVAVLKKEHEERIIYALKQIESRAKRLEVCRQLGVGELRRLKQLKEANRKLKQLVADLRFG